MSQLTPTLVLGLVIAGVFIVVVWVLLPFAVFGLKPLVRQLLAEQRRTNELLAAQSGTPPAPPPPY